MQVTINVYYFPKFLLRAMVLCGTLAFVPSIALSQEDEEPGDAPSSGEDFFGRLLEGPVPANKPKRNSWHLEDYDETDKDSDSLWSLLFDATIGAAAGFIFYESAASTISGSKGIVTAYTSARFDDEEAPSAWEVQYNELWLFESRRNRALASGGSTAFFRDLEWQGTNGFQIRLTRQNYVRMATEITLDHVVDHEFNSYDGMTSFATLPTTSFQPSSVRTGRSAELISGQLNFLLRSNPSVFMYGGLRWWHHRDLLSLTTAGPTWEARTRVDAPIIQLGVQYGNIGKRLSWRNRFGFGMGPAMLESRTDAGSIFGAVSPIGDYAVRLAVLTELRTEVGYSVTKNLAVRTGVQLLGVTSSLRAPSQIDVTNLNTGATRIHNDAMFYSAIFAGLNLQY